MTITNVMDFYSLYFESFNISSSFHILHKLLNSNNKYEMQNLDLNYKKIENKLVGKNTSLTYAVKKLLGQYPPSFIPTDYVYAYRHHR